jgi:tRNA A58 N-methylase Trm61
MSFLNKYNSRSVAQNGFREKKYTYTEIQTSNKDIQKALDNKLFAMGIFLDLSKAFHVINHIQSYITN